MEHLRTAWETVAGGTYAPYIRAALILVAGLIVSRLVKRLVGRAQLRSQQLIVLRRFASGAILAVAFGWALAELGLNLGYLLGAAGVLTIAVGFASQTSVSNLISGLFLMSERPFVLGDYIEVDGKVGYVMSIDLLSVKLRTMDNVMVRIPNESMLKSNVTNLTHFEIRRIDLDVGVAYGEDLDKVRSVLLSVPDEIPVCLEEPAPEVWFMGFGDSSMNLRLMVWSTQENFLDVRTLVPERVKAAFNRAGIEIPFPQRTLHLAAGATKLSPSSA